MNITVTHTLHPDVLSLFKSLLGNVPSGVPVSAPVKEETTAKKGSKASAPAATATEPAAETTVTASAATEETTDKKPAVTAEQLRELVGQKSKAGKRDALKALLSVFGAENVTTLAADHYDAFYEKVKAL